MAEITETAPETESIQDKLSGIEQFIEEKKKPLLIAGGIILAVVIALVYVYAKYIPEKNLAAQNAMFMAEFQFKKDSFQLALNGGVSQGKPYIGFLDVSKKYGWTKAAGLANYYSGICYLNLKQFDKAIEYLKKSDPNDPIIGALRLSALGDASMELGKTDEGISYYEKAANYSDNDRYTPLFLFKAGLANERAKKNDEAKKLYEKIRDNYPNSDEGMGIERYITRVSAL